MADGLFLVVEGIDGAGTTTQARLLADWLRAGGRRVVLTAEPTDGPVGRVIRDILRGRMVAGGEEAMALLFAADRALHLHQTVLPAVREGAIVVSDRHYLSSLAYQGVETEMDWVALLNSKFPRPDLTMLLDIPAEVALARKAADGGEPERYEQRAYLEKVRANYLEAARRARAAGERVETLDASKSIEEVQAALRHLVAPLLP